MLRRSIHAAAAVHGTIGFRTVAGFSKFETKQTLVDKA
jgi:hypothetical protein